jgi:hypothetical protein
MRALIALALAAWGDIWRRRATIVQQVADRSTPQPILLFLLVDINIVPAYA